MTFLIAFRRSIQHLKPVHIYGQTSFTQITHKFVIFHLISSLFAQSIGNLSYGQCGRRRIYCALYFNSQFDSPFFAPRERVETRCPCVFVCPFCSESSIVFPSSGDLEFTGELGSERDTMLIPQGAHFVFSKVRSDQQNSLLIYLVSVGRSILIVLTSYSHNCVVLIQKGHDVLLCSCTGQTYRCNNIHKNYIFPHPSSSV